MELSLSGTVFLSPMGQITSHKWNNVVFKKTFRVNRLIIFELKKFESKQNIRFSKAAHVEQYGVCAKSQETFKFYKAY